MYIAEPNGSLRMPLRFLPLPFLHVCFACSVNCFLLLPFATRVPLFFGPLFLVGRSEHRPCLFIFLAYSYSCCCLYVLALRTSYATSVSCCCSGVAFHLCVVCLGCIGEYMGGPVGSAAD